DDDLQLSEMAGALSSSSGSAGSGSAQHRITAAAASAVERVKSAITASLSSGGSKTHSDDATEAAAPSQDSVLLTSPVVLDGGGKAVVAAQVLRPVALYDPFSDGNDRKYFNRALAYHISYDLVQGSQCMPTHLVATLMLMYRQGITREQLVQ